MKTSRFILVLLLLTTSWMTSSVRANVLGTDLQNFNPTTNGLDFVTVHSSETLEPGVLNMGYFINHAANSLPRFFVNGVKNEGSDRITGGDFNLGLGLMKNWDFGVSFPHILNQEIENSSGTVLNYEEEGLAEIRINTKYRLWGDQTQGIAVVASTNIQQTENNPFLGEDAGNTYNLELAADKTFGPVAVAANVGYRFRDPGEPIPDSNGNVLISPFQNQWIWSVAANYLVSSIDTKVIFEVLGSSPAEDDPDFLSDRQQQTLEALLGIKHDVSHRFALHLGGGSELSHSVATPDWRVYGGINWAFGPLWSTEKKEAKKTVATEKMLVAKEVFDETPEEDLFADSGEDLAFKEPQETMPIEDLTPQTPTTNVENFYLSQDAYFDFNSTQINPQLQDLLQRLIDHIEKGPGFVSLIVKGHTDSVGSDSFNFDLSLRRAQAIKEYITGRQVVPSNKVWVLGFGETQPIDDNGNFQGRQANRRVEFEIYRDKQKASYRAKELAGASYEDGFSGGFTSMNMSMDCFLRIHPNSQAPVFYVMKKGRSIMAQTYSLNSSWLGVKGPNFIGFIGKACAK